MSASAPVATLDDLDSLDINEIVAGYRDWRSGDPEPGPNRGRAYWHGWMNGARDTAECWQLVREMVRNRRAGDGFFAGAA